MGFYRKVDDHYEVRIDQNRLVILGIGAGLLVALLFLVGILIGKTLWGVGPEEVALLREARTRPPPEPDYPEVSEKPKFTFYQETKLPAGEEPVAPPAATAPAAAPDASATVMIGPKRSLSTGPEDVPGRTPVAEPGPSPQPVPAPATAPKAVPETPPAPPKKPAPEAPAPAMDGGYAVQVASCREKGAADDTARRIAAVGGRAEISKVTIKGTQWYRVRAVGFSSKAQAEKFNAEKLKPKGLAGAIVAP